MKTVNELAIEIESALVGGYRLLIFVCENEVLTLSHFGVTYHGDGDCQDIEDINVNTNNWDCSEEELEDEIEEWSQDKALELAIEIEEKYGVVLK